jgi:exodeoxyribonuclease V beta subunit
MESNYFDPVETQLLRGVNLIEASAGTGKTYAIAMWLYVLWLNRA